MNKTGIQEILTNHPELKDKLFARGFLLTNAIVDTSQYPFYGNWKTESFGSFHLAVSSQQHYSRIIRDHVTLLLVGHAYNPFKMIPDEKEILENLSNEYSSGVSGNPPEGFWNAFSELTGVFTLMILDGDTLYLAGDASGMQTTFYTKEKDTIWISSHTNLIGDLLDLEWDPYIRKLANYRFFKLLGNSLPGDLTQYRNVKRLIPNHYVRIQNDETTVNRFYWPTHLNKTKEEIVSEVAGLMHANMELISRKWQKPAISMTGGCDSKTTLACTEGLYDRFSYFSYISSEAEQVDAEAAQKICESLGLKHTIYTIPEDDSKVPKVSEAGEIINWNTGNIRRSHPNDIRKRVFFADTPDFDVEVKSWASEIGRAYYSKRFNGRTNFGKQPTPRKCTTMYKFFFTNRKLVRETDEVFREYLQNYFEQAKQNPVEWQEQFFWEFRVPSWNGLVITGEHRYSFDITIPYNNRRILELLLSAPIESRITDEIYQQIRNKMNPKIDENGISVTNLKHTVRRGKLENLYYLFHSSFPF